LQLELQLELLLLELQLELLLLKLEVLKMIERVVR